MISISNDKVFHLQTNKTSYIFRILPTGQSESLYYGRRIPVCEDYKFIFDKHDVGYSNTVIYSKDEPKLSLDHITLEYSAYGKGDYRLPAMDVVSENQSFTTDFKYSRHALYDEKPILHGLPSSYGSLENLVVVFEDKTLGAELHLIYTDYEKCNVITRSARLINKSEKSMRIKSMMSMQLDLPMGDYTMLTFNGAWIREMHKHEHKLNAGTVSSGSINGTSSNRANPFFIIENGVCTETAGDCYGFNLVYSGNHIERAEVSPHGLLRIQTGINPFEFEWLLESGSSFDTPEAVLTFSHEGLGGMSRNMHAFVKEHIVRGKWKYKERPILVNNWEATYFNFNEKKILDIAKSAKELGAEMFVLDDGWFGKRGSDKSSLGDWYVNKNKLPHGIDGLSSRINEMGLKFGLWVEPEMISVNSQLYKAHPDWAVTTDGYTPSEGRNQLVLDLTRYEVREFLINILTDVFRYGNIEYIKWDMNRPFSDVFSHGENKRCGEFFHRYVLGLYEIWQALTERFPEILFEACSSGGNRFDLGTFCYMPQCWTSDDTDALERVYIQSGASYGYPQSVMTMHVACSPSFACFRPSSIENRFNVSAFGLLGYELDVTTLSAFDKVCVKKQIEYYKAHRKLLQYGEFYRIGDFFTDNIAKWEIVSHDKSEAAMGYFINRSTPNGGNDVIKFTGLDENGVYELSQREQLINIRTFGGIFNTVLPKKIDVEDGKFYDKLTNIVRLPAEKVKYTLFGSSLMYSGFKPGQPFVLSGFSFDTRMLVDTDSRLYYLKKAEK
ncbi:MAG: alpha-galactosidase [Clostridia bacterium]|nr:alpha-galactosidase [Clostridia bacterium]